jgi:hypothetical protein
MRSRDTDRAGTSDWKWTIDIRASMQFVLVIAVLMGAAALLRRASQDATRRQIVKGSIQDTRIVADHAVETRWGGQATWRVDYKVAYLASGHYYAVWADSGIRGESEAEVKLALPKSLPACEVRYNSTKPQESVAECR